MGIPNEKASWSLQKYENIELTWNDNTAYEDNYIVFRKEGNSISGFEEIKLKPNTKKYIDETIKDGTVYEYGLGVRNRLGMKPASNGIQIITKLYPPSNLRIGRTTKTSLELTWTSNTFRAKYQDIMRDQGSGYTKIATFEGI